LFADEAILTLDAPILRVTGRGGPLAPNEEHLALPDVADIVQAMERVAHY
jgi:pyruvate/2-oxoglutarate/acetoin dehydrogenase E1 component